MACSSDHGTIHVFQVQLDTSGGIKLSNDEKDGDGKQRDQELGASAAADDAKPQNKKSKFNFMKGINNYFGSQWSFARFKMPDSDNSHF